jgi:hypothetical protein
MIAINNLALLNMGIKFKFNLTTPCVISRLKSITKLKIGLKICYFLQLVTSCATFLLAHLGIQ